MTYCKSVAIFTKNAQFNVVESFYGLVPFEPADANFTHALNKIVRVQDLTFEKLLDTMIVEVANCDMFVIVDHGIENSLKKVWRLSMPLTDHSNMKTRDDLMKELLKFMNSNSSAADMEDYEQHHGLKQDGVAVPALPAGSVSRIVDKMRQLRRLKVRWVSIRACALGTNPDFMDTLGQCFGARFISAPDVHMFYSQPLKPNKQASQAHFDSFVKTHAGARTFDDGSGAQLALQVQGSGPLRNIKGSTTATELKWFMDRYFDQGNKYPSGNQYFQFQIEGMDTLGLNKYALPREAEYAQHIVWRGPLAGNMI